MALLLGSFISFKAIFVTICSAFTMLGMLVSFILVLTLIHIQTVFNLKNLPSHLESRSVLSVLLILKLEFNVLL